MSLGSTIQNPSPRSSGLLWHKRYFETVFTVAPPLARHCRGGNLRSFGDPPVGPAIGAGGVGLEQDASVEQFAGVRPAAADERSEFCPRSSSVRRTTYLLRMARTPALLTPMRVQDRVVPLNLSVTED